MKQKKIVLTAINASYSHTSLSCRCLAKSCGSPIEVCEFTINDRIETLLMQLYLRGADVYAFSCYIWNMSLVLDIAARLKLVLPQCEILLGGPEVSYDAAALMERHSFIDYIICGEGETAFSAFAGGGNNDGIPGLVYRTGDKIVQNPPRVIADLDRLPRLYTAEDLRRLDGKMIYYETSRGCPFGCSYCLSSTSRGVRYFGLERVLEDIRLFIASGVKLVKLVDRTFNADPAHSAKILRFILEQGGSTCFHLEVGAHLLSEELISILKTAPDGIFQLEIGVQSTNPDTVRAINRSHDFEKLKANVTRLRETGNIHLHLDLIAGLPYEDYRSFAKSFNDVYALRPHALQLGFLKLLKGSAIREQSQAFGYVFADKPPYEVMGSEWLTYGDIVRLKGIEDMVDKYHNSGAFSHALQYVLQRFEGSAFAFFEAFSQYWRDKGYDLLKHSRQELYGIFYAFYISLGGAEDAVFTDLLKLDFILHNKNAVLPPWADSLDGKKADKRFYNKIYDFLQGEGRGKYLPDLGEVSRTALLQRIRVECFNFDVCNGGGFGQNVVLVDYGSKKYMKISEKI